MEKMMAKMAVAMRTRSFKMKTKTMRARMIERNSGRKLMTKALIMIEPPEV